MSARIQQAQACPLARMAAANPGFICHPSAARPAGHHRPLLLEQYLNVSLIPMKPSELANPIDE